MRLSAVQRNQLRVVLHFAETVFGLAGKRVFDVFVNGNALVRRRSSPSCAGLCPSWDQASM